MSLEQHRLFAAWVYENQARFLAVLRERERLCGEWLAQAHGTRYELQHEPFVGFDLMVGTKRYPFDIDTFLRQADRAYLGGDLETARALYACLLPAIGSADIDLGQHETVDEVLTVAVSDCAARYLAVYCTTRLGERASALQAALEKGEGLAYLAERIAAMERVATGPLPGLSEFLLQWVEQLDGNQTSDGEWESAHDHRLREAVERSEGVAGLERSRVEPGDRPFCGSGAPH